MNRLLGKKQGNNFYHCILHIFSLEEFPRIYRKFLESGTNEVGETRYTVRLRTD